MLKYLWNNKLLIVLNSFLFFIIIYGIYTAFQMNEVSRSFWLDEAVLASSFSKRSLIELYSKGELEYLQSAPLGWLYLEKILSLIWSNTEKVLRYGSFISYCLVIVFLIVAQVLYRSKLPFSAAAVFANAPIALQYSNIFKQYEFEAFISTVILVTFILYEKNFISLKILIPLWMVFLWFSNSACFVEGGFVASTLLFSLFSKDKRKIRDSIFIGLAISLSFVFYYFAWVRIATSIKGMQDYWNYRFFPLSITNVGEYEKSKNLLKIIFSTFQYEFLPLFVFIGSLYSFLVKKDKAIIAVYLTVVLLIITSALRLYPIELRLCLFCYPLIFFVCVYAFELAISVDTKLMSIFIFILLVCYAWHQNGIDTYSNTTSVYWKGEELKPTIKYLNDNLKEDEKIYVYKHSVPTFEYLNGYGNTSFGNWDDNIIYGDIFFNDNNSFENEINKIIINSKLYIVLSHVLHYRISHLMDYLHQYGYLELVQYDYNTPLFYFVKDKADSKLDYDFEVLGRIKKGNLFFTTIRVQNTWKSFLADPYNKTYLTSKDGYLYEFNNFVVPGEYIDIVVSYPQSKEPVFYLKKQFGDVSKKKIIKLYKHVDGYVWGYDLIKRVKNVKASSWSEFQRKLAKVGVNCKLQKKRENVTFELSKNVYFLKTGTFPPEKLQFRGNVIGNEYTFANLMKRYKLEGKKSY